MSVSEKSQSTVRRLLVQIANEVSWGEECGGPFETWRQLAAAANQPNRTPGIAWERDIPPEMQKHWRDLPSEGKVMVFLVGLAVEQASW